MNPLEMIAAWIRNHGQMGPSIPFGAQPNPTPGQVRTPQQISATGMMTGPNQTLIPIKDTAIQSLYRMTGGGQPGVVPPAPGEEGRVHRVVQSREASQRAQAAAQRTAPNPNLPAIPPAHPENTAAGQQAAAAQAHEEELARARQLIAQDEARRGAAARAHIFEILMRQVNPRMTRGQ